VIQRAILHVQSSGKKEVTGANVLVAIFGEKESHAVYFLNQRGVLQWKATEKAANGTDTGCFDVDLAKWPAAVEDLSRLVFGIKSRGDRALAEKTRDEWVGDGTAWADLRGVIQERWLRAPKASFVYAIQVGPERR